jgi:UV DNA damage endonuclease
MNRFGYCCICLTLAEKKITTNRGMIQKTFKEKGLGYVSELALKNVQDLIKVLEWNASQGIMVFRMSSDMFPWWSEYELEELPLFTEIAAVLSRAGEISRETGQRHSYHPSHFSVLASATPDVVRRAVKDIDQHARIMDIMGLPGDRNSPINIHINTVQGGKEAAMLRFIENYALLSESAQRRLVVENDDKPGQFTPKDLYEGLYKRTGIPITFDYHHHMCNPDGLSQEESLKLALSTWECLPMTHFSDSRRRYEDAKAKEVAHSDWIWNRIETYGASFDIECEVKSKDLALLKYFKEFEKK